MRSTNYETHRTNYENSTKMPGGYKNIKGTDGNTFSSTNQPANAGRPPSFKNAYKEILGESGSVIWVDENTLLERTTADGKKQVGLQLNKVQTLLSRLDRMATGKNEKLSFEVIRFLWEQIDGKAAQPLTGDPDKPIAFVLPPGTKDTDSDPIE